MKKTLNLKSKYSDQKTTAEMYPDTSSGQNGVSLWVGGVTWGSFRSESDAVDWCETKLNYSVTN